MISLFFSISMCVGFLDTKFLLVAFSQVENFYKITLILDILCHHHLSKGMSHAPFKLYVSLHLFHNIQLSLFLLFLIKSRQSFICFLSNIQT
ncbi:unnamed protein product, partial [Vitis vinifera]|uniref:Uncharacterized protein n=1 Tax=Vitis vinifera TaxID=29760 RepID=D7SZX8_VITVI